MCFDGEEDSCCGTEDWEVIEESGGLKSPE